MKRTLANLLVLPRTWHGNVKVAARIARRFEGTAFPKFQAASFESFEPLVIVGADEVLRKMLRIHNRVEPLQ